MRVATFNVHGWLTPDGAPNVDLVVAVLARCAADVIALNEVWHPAPLVAEADAAQQSRANSAGAALDEVAARLGLSYAFGQVAPAQTASGDRLPYGNAVMSRWPIVAHASHRLPAGSYSVPRGLLEVRVALPTPRTLTVYATHFDHRSELARLEQWAAAQSWLVRERGRPHLVLGDFNALAAADYADPASLEALGDLQADRGWPPPVFDLTNRVLAAGYIDAFAERGQGPGATWPAHRPERRVDYIFLPAGAVRVTASRRCDGSAVALASDHRPVWADIEFQ